MPANSFFIQAIFFFASWLQKLSCTKEMNKEENDGRKTYIKYRDINLIEWEEKFFSSFEFKLRQLHHKMLLVLSFFINFHWNAVRMNDLCILAFSSEPGFFLCPERSSIFKTTFRQNLVSPYPTPSPTLVKICSF